MKKIRDCRDWLFTLGLCFYILEQHAAVAVMTRLYFFLQVYIARTEGSSVGTISWKFDFAPAGLKIKSVSIMASSQTFHSGKVCWHLQAGQITTEFPGGMLMFKIFWSNTLNMIVWQWSLLSCVWTFRWEDAVVPQSVRLLRVHCCSRTQWRRRGVVMAARSALQTKLKGDRRHFIWNSHRLRWRRLTAALPNKIGPAVLLLVDCFDKFRASCLDDSLLWWQISAIFKRVSVLQDD